MIYGVASSIISLLWPDYVQGACGGCVQGCLIPLAHGAHVLMSTFWGPVNVALQPLKIGEAIFQPLGSTPKK